jgi:hypothetical protein
MIILKVLGMAVALFLIMALPQILNDAISALPQPMPTVIGCVMFITFAVGAIALLNKLMKGTN